MPPKLAPLGSSGTASVMTDADKQKCKEKYDKYADVIEGESSLTKENLKRALQDVFGPGISEGLVGFSSFDNHVDQEFMKADKDLSGRLDFNEFLTIYHSFPKKKGVL